MDRSNGSTDLLDMAFISPNLAKHDIQFQIGDDLGNDHLPIEVSIDAPPYRNSSVNHTKYKFDCAVVYHVISMLLQCYYCQSII